MRAGANFATETGTLAGGNLQTYVPQKTLRIVCTQKFRGLIALWFGGAGTCKVLDSAPSFVACGGGI
jgi:hypothetical protein